MLELLLKKRSGVDNTHALRDYGGRWNTYGDLENWSNGIAAKLLEKGVGMGDRVVSLMHNNSMHVALFFATVKIGAILVPINPALNSDLISRMIEGVQPSLVIDDYGGRGEKSSIFESYAGKPFVPEYINDDNRAAMILHTGGTTGDPKGAILTVKSILWNGFNTITSWNLSSRDSTLISLPLYHTGGWNILLMPFLICGARATIGPDKFDATTALRLISSEKLTQYMAVPAMYSAMVKTKEFESFDLTHTQFISGGGGLPPATIRKIREKGIRIFQGYGLTEAGPNNFNISNETFLKKPNSVGKPNLFVEMKLKGDGELAIRGPHLFAGYWNRPDEKYLDADGFLLTGDIFEIDEDGDYSFVDRKKNMIKTGGENVYASEVESAITQLEGIQDCCVIGLPDDHWGEMVTAFLVTTNNSLNEDSVKRELRKRLAGFKVPKRVIFIEAIPKSDIGKPLKQKLRETYETSLHQ